MGEENKGEGKKEGEKKEEVSKEEKKEEKKEEEEENIEIVLKVDMHCEACARKVTRSLKGFQGVEEVTADYKASKVVVKGNKSVDPVKVCERIQKKSGRKVDLISPIPKPPAEETKQEIKEPPKEEKKDEPPPVATVVLKVQMHCEACAQVLHKRIKKIKGVESVTTELGSNEVRVKGVVDPEKLARDVYKKTGKQASVVKEEEKKEEKKEGEKKESEKEGEKREGEEIKGEEDEKKTETEIKKSEFMPPKYYLDYAYPPQIFSDENPHACTLM